MTDDDKIIVKLSLHECGHALSALTAAEGEDGPLRECIHDRAAIGSRSELERISEVCRRVGVDNFSTTTFRVHCKIVEAIGSGE